MDGFHSTAGLEFDFEPVLSIEEIESRLVEAARRHHLEERNVAYWLHEIDARGLYKERGFSSLGDYAMELAGIKPRKAHYLAFIARRLEKLPRIREAFDSGELSWTKAREITGVATAETEAEWLEKARLLSNRDLEREVRRHDGRGSGGFATLTISMPVEVLEMWHDAYELTERMNGTELEKWHVLESSLAELLATHLPAVNGTGPSTAETPPMEEEKRLSESLRNEILERGGWLCAFPGCTMRKTLDVHHIVFRSQGGRDEPENLVCLCRQHHALVHRGICSVTGRVGVDLKFERPRLVSERARSSDEPPAALDPPHERSRPNLVPPSSGESTDANDEIDDVDEVDDVDDGESWREETVADIFGAGGPPPPKPPRPETGYADFLLKWAGEKRKHDLEARSRKRRGRPTGGPARDASAHVCTGGTARGATEPGPGRWMGED